MNVYTIADDLTDKPKLTREQIIDIAKKGSERRKARIKARKKKIKEGFKKLGRGLATVFLAPARGAFYAYVALNINGIANQLKYIFDNEKGKTKPEAEKIKKQLKKIGVRKFGTLMKSISQGSKKKPFFFSKKAKRKLTAQAKEKGFKAKGINGNDGIYLTGVEIAGIVGASAAVVGAMIPVILKAMEKKGDAAQVQQVAQTGQDTLQTLQQSPEVRQYQAENPSAAQTDSAESLEGIYVKIPTFDVPGTRPRFDYSALTQGLTQLAGVGIQAAGAAIQRRAERNPQLGRLLQRGNDAVENYAAGAYLRKAGAIDDAKAISQSYSNITSYIVPIAVAGGLALFLTRKK